MGLGDSLTLINPKQAPPAMFLDMLSQTGRVARCHKKNPPPQRGMGENQCFLCEPDSGLKAGFIVAPTAPQQSYNNAAA